jgi:thiamine kinase-like enzyme
MLISDIRYLKPQLITPILRAHEVIGDNEEVAQIRQVRSDESNSSKHYVLALQYKDFRTQRHAPDRIFVKIGLPNQTEEFSKREVMFYERIVRSMKRKLPKEVLRFPTCYDAFYDEEKLQYHLILEDISQEFKASPDKAPPTPRHREQVIDTLAYFHAYWWEHPLLEDLAPLPSAESLDENLAGYQERLTDLKASVGKFLNSKHLDVLAKIAAAYPKKRRERLLAGQGITLVHRDLHPGNILYSPRESLIVDWQSWHIDTATDDLAYMIAFFWPQHLRHFQEMPLLQRYHEILLAQGIKNYSWDEFLYDYKASTARCLGFLLQSWTRTKHASGIWQRMELGIDTFLAMDGLAILD